VSYRISHTRQALAKMFTGSTAGAVAALLGGGTSLTVSSPALHGRIALAVVLPMDQGHQAGLCFRQPQSVG
jgi:hypothetical protein